MDPAPNPADPFGHDPWRESPTMLEDCSRLIGRVGRACFDPTMPAEARVHAAAAVALLGQAFAELHKAARAQTQAAGGELKR
jgi:hypothetical protein